MNFNAGFGTNFTDTVSTARGEREETRFKLAWSRGAQPWRRFDIAGASQAYIQLRSILHLKKFSAF